MSGLAEGIGTAIGIGGDVASIFGGGPDTPRAGPKPFKGPIGTPGFRFAGGQLTRRTEDVSAEEARIRGLLGTQLGNLDVLRARLAPVGGQIAAGLGRVPGLFEGSAALRGDLRTLAAEVTPGFGRLTESLVEGVRNREAESVGNLRQALSQRNVLGASFANREIARTQLDFAQEEERVRAEALIGEIQLREEIIGQAGQLLQLDQATLAAQSDLIGRQLQLSDQDRLIMTQQLQTIQTTAALLKEQVARELAELGIATDFLSVVNQRIDSTAEAAAQDLMDQILIAGGGGAGEGPGPDRGIGGSGDVGGEQSGAAAGGPAGRGGERSPGGFSGGDRI